jgi:hypothetical protein
MDWQERDAIVKYDCGIVSLTADRATSPIIVGRSPQKFYLALHHFLSHKLGLGGNKKTKSNG